MRPIWSLAPDLVANDFTAYWVYLAGPCPGAGIAVLVAFVMRGRGGGSPEAAAG